MSERGSALIITLGVILMLSLVSITMVDTAQQDMNVSFNQVNTEQALYVAEAGAKRALKEIENDTTWRVGFADIDFDQGTYWVAVIDSAANAALADTLILRSVGRVNEANAQIEAWLAPARAPGRFQWGTFARDKLVMLKGSWIDSYDSDLGDYASQAVNGPDAFGRMHAFEHGHMRSNGGIKFSSGSGAYGDVTTSLAAGLNIADGFATGDTTSTDTAITLDPIDPADIAWAQSNNDAPTNLSFIGSATYDVATKELLGSNGATVTFTSGVYYFSKVVLTSGCNLEIAPGAQVVIYVTGDWSTQASSMVNPDGLPANVQIYSTGTKFEISGASGFWAAVYAPDAKIHISDTGHVYGSYIGREFDNSGGSLLHYDEALTRRLGGAIGKYRVMAWRQL
jgi:hypothetical protein